MKPRSKAFTLIELMVSIGIIALLIGILLPTLNKARGQANSVKCMNNMRQLVTAVTLYCRDNNDRLPNTGWNHSFGMPNWAYKDIGGSSGHTGKQAEVQGGQIWKYLNDTKVYHCPQDLGPYIPGTFNNLSSYCLNGAVTDYGGSNYGPLDQHVGLNLLQFHPDDVLFWEFAYDPATTNGADDGTNYPSEGVVARHKKGTCIAHMDGHANIVSAKDEFNTWCHVPPFPNQLYCDPLAADGGASKAAGYPNPINIMYE